MTNQALSESLPKGTILQWKYVIEEMLEQDLMGFTYLAQNHDVSHNNVGKRGLVMIKELFLKGFQSRINDPYTVGTSDYGIKEVEFYKRQFIRQAQELRRLNHPYWLSITDVFEENETLYYVTDYVQAETIREYVRHDVLTEQQVLSAFHDIASVFHEMFSLNLLHTDISPDNILIANDGHAYVKGFGFPNIYPCSEEDADCLIGDEPGRSYRYSPPECENGKAPTVVSEIFSLGATLYYMLTKELPPDIDDLLYEGFPYQKFNSKISKHTLDCIAKAMAPRRVDRYQSIDEMITAMGFSVSEIASIGQQQETTYTDSTIPVSEEKTNKDEWTTILDEQGQQSMLPCGTVLEGRNYRYEVVKMLGQGSFGITYLAKVKMVGTLGALDTNLFVCVKEFFMSEINGRQGMTVTCSSQTGLYSYYRQKFIHEAEHLGSLEHPNIIKVLERFEANNTAYFVMEFIDGGSLNDYIKQFGRLDISEAVRLIRQIGSALSFMHSRRMLHLDLKPGNIMMRKTGEPVLIDFGLSKQYNAQGQPETTTSVGGGTPGYAPLEQINYRDGKDFPVTMDVYAFAATFYKMLTGMPPKNASDILNEGFDRQPLVSYGISDDVISLIETGLSPMKRNRPQSVDDFLNRINPHYSEHRKEPHVQIEPVKRIVINNMTTTGIDSDFFNIKSIDIEEHPFSEGKIGKLYHCLGINGGAFKNPQVIKIFKDNEDKTPYNTIKKLQERLVRKKVELEESQHIDFLTYYPALFAVPQFVFEGMLDGKPVRGYSANDLKAYDYCCLHDVLDDSDKADIYDGISMNSRYSKAYHLMHALKLLHDINYVPNNLKTDNIFVSLNNDDGCAIIDYDEGVIDNKESNPSYVRGSFHDMLAPEKYRQLKENGCIIASADAERWSAAVACHYLLFLIHPFGFLTEVTDNSLSAYKERFVWPNVDDSFSFIDADNGREVSEYIKACCDALPSGVFECFKQTFTRGCLYPDVRTSFTEWCIRLKSKVIEHE